MASKSSEILLEQRAYIKIRSLLSDTQRNIHQDLVTVFGEEACSESTVKKWSLRFRGGRESIEDDPRMGQPVAATTPNNIALEAEMCDSDQHIKVEQLAGTLDLSTGSVHTILPKHLGMSKVCSRWVPHFLTKAQKENRLRMAKNLFEKYEYCDERRLSEICTGDEIWIRYSEPPRKQHIKVWVAKGSAPPGLPRPDRWAPRVIYKIFLMRMVQCAKSEPQRGKQLLATSTQQLFFQRSKNIILSVDQAPNSNESDFCTIMPDHTNLQVKETIASMSLEELEHPPYSPDRLLAPRWAQKTSSWISF